MNSKESSEGALPVSDMLSRKQAARLTFDSEWRRLRLEFGFKSIEKLHRFGWVVDPNPI